MKLRTTNVILPAGFRVEAKLLLCCVQGFLQEGNSERLQSLLEEEIDWDCVVRKACLHGIVPIVYRTLEGMTEERVPKAILNKLHIYTRMIADRNTLLVDELNTILKLFSSQGIEVMPLKGPLLATELYGNLELRPITDLDILVRTQDVPKAKRLLLARGYLPEKDLSARQEKEYLTRECAFHFYQANGKLNVDLHWRLIRWQAFKSDFLWSRAVTVRSGEIQSLWLAPEELLLYLCIHLDKSPDYRLKWVLDIALVLVKHPTMNWDRVKELACETGNRRTILRVLYVVERILDVPAPQKLAREVHAYPRNTAYASLIMGQLFRDDLGLPGFCEWCRYMEMLRVECTSARLNWLPLRPLFQYLRVVIERGFVERKAVKILRSLSCPYWLYQPIRLVWRHTSRLLKRLR